MLQFSGNMTLWDLPETTFVCTDVALGAQRGTTGIGSITGSVSCVLFGIPVNADLAMFQSFAYNTSNLEGRNVTIEDLRSNTTSKWEVSATIYTPDAVRVTNIVRV
jgi:hypothetical protein